MYNSQHVRVGGTVPSLSRCSRSLIHSVFLLRVGCCCTYTVVVGGCESG